MAWIEVGAQHGVLCRGVDPRRLKAPRERASRLEEKQNQCVEIQEKYCYSVQNESFPNPQSSP